jgi:hypothetical protein
VKTGVSLLRRLALRLMQHVAHVLPASRQEWAEAMRNELEHIDGDLGAVRWAAGCVVASYVEGGLSMDQQSGSFVAMVRKPSAFVPLVMSLAALTVVGVALITGHLLVREQDEGWAAHLWQLLMAGQLPVLAFFLIKWFPRDPQHALYVLGLQITAVLAAMAPVYLLHL